MRVDSILFHLLALRTVIFFSLSLVFVGLAYQGKDIVFRFIIEYSSSLRDFGPWVIIIIGLFLYEDF
jgi:hypothetical protein